MTDVFACFELNAVDASILRAVKTYAPAMAWRDEDLSNRFLVAFTVDHEREIECRANPHQED